MDRTRWIVTLKDGEDLAQARDRLTEAGLAVGEALEIGVVIGTAGPRAASKLRAVPGVADVTKEGSVSVGPPGTPDSW